MASALSEGKVCTSLEQLAREVDVVSLCVGNDNDVRETVRVMLPHLKAGAVILDHTTTSSALAQEMHALCTKHHVRFGLPRVGRPSGCGKTACSPSCVAVTKATFERVRPILALYSQYQRHFGASGAGQGAKMVNQILVVNVVQGLAEGITLGKALGLDIEALVNTLKRGAANSWQLGNRGLTMSEGKI